MKQNVIEKQEYKQNMLPSSNRLKIVSGLGSIDDYIRLVKAGADEFFCGIVPYEWSDKYGVISPLNRREVLFYHVQLGGFGELKILKAMVDEYQVPVKLTLNSLYYQTEQYPYLEEMITRCMELGFTTFIIADPALIIHLRNKKIGCQIHLSGEMAEVNHLMMKEFSAYDIKRFIFHRKNTIEDMRSCIETDQVPGREYEAFILNERCHYTGAFCNSLHCDELTHLCRVPYQMVPMNKEETSAYLDEVAPEDRMEESEDRIECEEDSMEYQEDGYHTGETGCGLCAIKQLMAAGVTHLKLVGRGNHADYMEQDILKLKKAIEYAQTIDDEQEYISKIKNDLLGGYCSGECYYKQKNCL